jgi:flagellar biosynthesis/type III secretory pathway protein FliH
MASVSTVLKGPGVQARTLLVSNAFIDRIVTGGDPAAPSHGHGAGAQSGGAPRGIAETQAEANRLLGQAQVELGRAQAYADDVRRQAEARLAEAGEVVSTAAEARRLLAEARAAAGELAAGAEAEVAAAFAAAREDGFAEGRRAGYEEGIRLAQEELRGQLDLAHGIAAQAKVDREQLIADGEPEIIRLALEIARKVVAREVENDPDILKGLLTRAMLKAAGNDRIRLRLNPVAIERLGTYLSDTAARFADRGVDVVPDRTVEIAGCVVETRAGTIDATAGTQLAKIGRAMLALTGE